MGRRALRVGRWVRCGKKVAGGKENMKAVISDNTIINLYIVDV